MEARSASTGGGPWRPPDWGAIAAPAQETPKNGGTLNYVIPADAPPSFDAHRETTFATIHSAAPFYSVLIRVDPNNPGSTTDFVCDLCTAMPQPTDDGKTYTFKIRSGVKFHDGSPLTAADVAASWQHIIHPPAGRAEPAREPLRDGRHGRRPRPDDRGVSPEIRDQCLLAGARRPLQLDLQERRFSTRIHAGTKRTSSARARSSSSTIKSASRSRA